MKVELKETQVSYLPGGRKDFVFEAHLYVNDEMIADVSNVNNIGNITINLVGHYDKDDNFLGNTADQFQEFQEWCEALPPLDYYCELDKEWTKLDMDEELYLFHLIESKQYLIPRSFTFHY